MFSFKSEPAAASMVPGSQSVANKLGEGIDSEFLTLVLATLLGLQLIFLIVFT